MKLSMKKILSEISRWKKQGVPSTPLFQRLQELAANGKTFIHFTNQPTNLQANLEQPRKGRVTGSNPTGFYGYLLTPKLLEKDEHRLTTGAERKNLVVFTVPPNLNLLKLDGKNLGSFEDTLEQKNELLGWNRPDFDENGKETFSDGPRGTKYLMSKGYDGILSLNHGLSGDIENEICVFQMKNVQVIDVFVNTLASDSNEHHALSQAKEQAKMDYPPKYPSKSARERSRRLGVEANYHASRAREKRKKFPL